MHVITAFGLVYLTEYFGHWGIIILIIPMSIGFAFGVYHFKRLEIEAGNYY